MPKETKKQETWTDPSTGLTWCLIIDTSHFTYQEAYIQAGKTKIGGIKWRIPTIKELGTLLDYELVAPPVKDPLTKLIPPGYYWSSTHYAPNVNYLWAMNLVDGCTYSSSNEDILFLLCVSDDKPRVSAKKPVAATKPTIKKKVLAAKSKPLPSKAKPIKKKVSAIINTKNKKIKVAAKKPKKK
jgi:hypothetical protein